RLAAEIDEAFDIMDPDVFPACAQQDEQVETGEGGGTGAGCDDLDVGQVLAGVFEAVEDGGGDDDRGSVLIVVEDRDVHLLAQAAFDLEAFRSLDILQIDPAEGRLQRRDSRDHRLDVIGVDLDVENVDGGKFLEQDRLAFHHRL